MGHTCPKSFQAAPLTMAGRTVLAAFVLLSLLLCAASCPEEPQYDQPADLHSYWSWNTVEEESADDFPSLVVANVKRYLRWGQNTWASVKRPESYVVERPANASWSWKNSTWARATRTITAKARQGAFLNTRLLHHASSMARKVQYWLQAWNVSNVKCRRSNVSSCSRALTMYQKQRPRIWSPMSVVERKRSGVSVPKLGGVSEMRAVAISIPIRTGVLESPPSVGLSEAALNEIARQTIQENRRHDLRRKRVGVYTSVGADTLRELSVHELKRAMAWHGAVCDHCVEKTDLVEAIVAARDPVKVVQRSVVQRSVVPVRKPQADVRVDSPKVVTLEEEPVETFSDRMVHEYREIREKQHELHTKRSEVLWGKMILQREAHEVALNRSAVAAEAPRQCCTVRQLGGCSRVRDSDVQFDAGAAGPRIGRDQIRP